MKPAILISSVQSNINLPKRNLEIIANYSGSKLNTSSSDFELPGYENVSWRFLNARGNGNVWVTQLDRRNNKVSQREISLSARFLAVCTKSPTRNYELLFGISLS